MREEEACWCVLARNRWSGRACARGEEQNTGLRGCVRAAAEPSQHLQQQQEQRTTHSDRQKKSAEKGQTSANISLASSQYKNDLHIVLASKPPQPQPQPHAAMIAPNHRLLATLAMCAAVSLVPCHADSQVDALRQSQAPTCSCERCFGRRPARPLLELTLPCLAAAGAHGHRAEVASLKAKLATRERRAEDCSAATYVPNVTLMHTRLHTQSLEPH